MWDVLTYNELLYCGIKPDGFIFNNLSYSVNDV
jgi:hypothetical protein